MYFEFRTANRILFGAGSLQQVDRLAAELGQRALLITGRSSQRAASLMKLLQKINVAVSSFSVSEEPTVTVLEESLVAGAGR